MVYAVYAFIASLILPCLVVYYVIKYIRKEKPKNERESEIVYAEKQENNR